jgi:enoyl-CoA hydratase/carnithine racemase
MEEIVTELSGNVLRLQFNRPSKKNAMTAAMYAAAAEELDKADKNDDVRVVLVHGVAVGGGTTMLPHFDFVYAAESTRFQIPFINLALVPELASSYTPPRQIGYLQAAGLILLGEPFSAARASELGLVTAIIPEQNVWAKPSEIAIALARKPAEALKACKKLLKAPDLESIDRTVSRELREFAIRVRSAEAKEAFAAFLAKRKPEGTREIMVARP